jgi:2'-5' RNA ligase
MRLFVAVDMSDEVRENIYSLYNIIKSFKGLKPVEKENIHITLKFLGEVPDQRVEIVKDRLGEVKAKAFRMHLKGIGFFPSGKHIRVIWVGVEEGNEEISRLAEMVENAMKRLGFKRDKSFVAHATIARVKNISPADKRKLLNELEPYMNSDFGWMDVKDFRLKKSTLTPSGPIYTDLAVYSLEA